MPTGADVIAQLRQCLPIYKAWGLAEREAVTDFDRLIASQPAPAPTSRERRRFRG